MKKIIKVALNMNNMSVPEKLVKARFVLDSIAANPQLFPSPVPALNTVAAAANALETAMQNAADGGKAKTAIMHEKLQDLMVLLTDLAAYVQRIANGDTEIVVTAGLDVKKPGFVHVSDFFVRNAQKHGQIYARVKSQKKTFYRWEYTKDPLGENEWQEALSSGKASAIIGGLDPGVKYWIRVVFITAEGEHVLYDPVSIIVC